VEVKELYGGHMAWKIDEAEFTSAAKKIVRTLLESVPERPGEWEISIESNTSNVVLIRERRSSQLPMEVGVLPEGLVLMAGDILGLIEEAAYPEAGDSMLTPRWGTEAERAAWQQRVKELVSRW